MCGLPLLLHIHGHPFPPLHSPRPLLLFCIYHIFRSIRCTTPQIWEENGGASYSPNVAYLVRRSREGGGSGGAGSQEAGAGPHFLLQIFFSYFPPLKPRCILWSGASYSQKNIVLVGFFTTSHQPHPRAHTRMQIPQGQGFFFFVCLIP